jgi:methyl-accepting chemotaxis protein
MPRSQKEQKTDIKKIFQTRSIGRQLVIAFGIFILLIFLPRLAAILGLTSTQVTYGTVMGTVLGLWLAIRTYRSVTKSFKGAVEELAGISEILSDSSRQQSEVAGRTSTVASQLASGATQQSKQSEEIAETISQMATAIVQMSSIIEDTAVGATKTSSEAQKAGQEGEKAQESLVKIKEVVTNSASMIGQISGSYKEIGDLVGEITGIADQTNILALNAAIEAARAGEAGRGFAVVADEVRRLAEGSRKFADEITDRIREATTQAETTVSTTTEGVKNIEISSEVISSTLSALQGIAQSVQEISAKIQEVSSNMQQQASSTEQVSKTVGSVAAVAGQNASSAQEVASAVDQQQIVVTTIDKSIEQLSTLLNDMRILIGLDVSEVYTVEEKTVPAWQESVLTPVSPPVRHKAEIEGSSVGDEPVMSKDRVVSDMKKEVESVSKKIRKHREVV